MSLSVVDQYRKFDTSLVSDALDEHDIDGVVNGIAPAHPDHFCVGLAEPVTLERVSGPDGTTNFPFGMFDRFASDAVLIIDGVDDTLSCWGGRASQLAADAGVNGVVIDGGYRDANEIYHGEFPVFASATTPRTGQQRVKVAAAGESVTMDGVKIAPDDVVIADSTGIVVVPADKAREVEQIAEGILAEELLLDKKIENGATVADLREHTF